MKAPTPKIRFNEASKLLDYGFSNYSYSEFGKSGDVINSIKVNKGVKTYVDAVLENSCGALVKKGQEKNLTQNIFLEDSLTAPISKGQKIGTISYILNDEVVCSTNIIANEDIEKISLWTMTKSLYKNWYILMRN